MKKLTNPFNVIALLLLLAGPMVSFASGDPTADKKRTISKSYTVGTDDKLSIENSFGDVTVSTWDQNQIQVTVEISVSAGSEEKAQNMMDKIKVTDRQSGKEIFFKTDIDGIDNNNNKKNRGGEQKFHIDYRISMPKINPLKIENSFGKINMGNFNGPVNLISKFGELNAGNLEMAKEVHVEFGSVAVGAIKDADVVFKFDNKAVIANLTGAAKVHIEFCNNVEFSVDGTIRSLSLMESYSTVRMNVPDNLSASFDVHTNFGSFRNHSGFSISEEGDDDNGPKFDRDFSGTAGSGSAKIKIRSSFGSVRLSKAGDSTSDEKADKEQEKLDKKKEKEKHKDKHKTEDDGDDDGDNDNDSGTDM